MDGVAEWLVNFIATYPNAVGWFAAVFAISTLTVNGLRMAWPNDDDRPRLVRFLLGFLDIGALNFWRGVNALKKDPAATGKP